MENLPFLDKVAIVTGSSRGIGHAIASALAREGADLVVTYRRGGKSAEKAEALCGQIRDTGRRAIAVQGDISVKADVQRMVSEGVEAMGRLDFLILNAAVAPFKPREKLFEKELKALVGVNYTGNILCLQAALPHLEKSGGTAVFISSLGSRFYNPSYPLGSMKAAMEAVVRDCGESLRDRGVNINGVSRDWSRPTPSRSCDSCGRESIRFPKRCSCSPTWWRMWSAFSVLPPARRSADKPLWLITA